MNPQRSLLLLVSLAVCFHAPAQTQPANDAVRLQQQCTAADDYAKLPPVQAKECRAWEEQEEEEYARMHLEGIQGAEQDAEDAATNAAADVKPLLAQLTPGQHVAYVRLRAAFKNFLAVQVSGGELYMPPYALGGLNDGGEFASEFLHAHFDRGVAHAIRHRTDLPGVYDGGVADDLPPGKPALSLDEADAKLNAAWQRLVYDLTSAHQPEQLARLRAEQRAWLTFRDRFADFALTVSPDVPRSTWFASMEANRAEELTQVDSMTASDAGIASDTQAALHGQTVESEQELMLKPLLARFTPEETAAWARVQSDLHDLIQLHDKTHSTGGAQFGTDLWNGRQAELIDIAQHPSATNVVYSAGDRELNTAYAAALASPCATAVFDPMFPERRRSAEELRAEQREWLRLRDDWVALAHLLAPATPQPQLAARMVLQRANYLRSFATSCAEAHMPSRNQ